MHITTLVYWVDPKKRDRDRVSNIEQPGRHMIDIKKSTAKETDKATSSDRMP